MISKRYHHKVMNKILFLIIFLILSINSAFAININTSSSFQTNCPWANVNETIYITGSTVNIYPTDLMRSNSKLLYVRNEESTVYIWQNTINTLSSGCSQPLIWNTWWARLSNVVPGTNQYVWIFKNFWNICSVNRVRRTDTSRPSVQFAYSVAYKEEISRDTGVSSYFYYPYVSWALQLTPSYISDQTKRVWWDVKYHAIECHNFTFAFCWDWTLDTWYWETCDDGNNIDWDGCSSTCQLVNTPACNSLVANPNTWNAPLTSLFTCSATNATSYRIDVFSGTTILNTINTRTWSYTFANTWSYTARCTINTNVTSAACLVPITVTSTTPPTPNIDIDKRDANSADLDNNIGNDTQTVYVWSWAVFRIRATNNYTESLRNIVLTDAIAPNCAWNVTLPSTFPSTWTGVTVWGLWDHTNTTLEVWEYIDYVCDRTNTTAWYTNSATVTGIGVTSWQSVTDTDTTIVLIPGWPTCWTAGWYSFSYTETAWPSNLTFCSPWATVNPNPPVFPAQNWSTSWTCNGNWSTVTCNASRWGSGGWWGWGWWWWPSCVRISVPVLEALWAWKAISSTWSVAVSCYGNIRAMVIWVDCDSDWNWATKSITYQSNSTVSWSLRVANFTCNYNNIDTVPHPKCYVTTWGWTVTTNSTSSLACSTWLSVWRNYCWDWVVQRPNNDWEMEECEAVNWIFPSWCIACKTRNYTYPGWGWYIATIPWNWSVFLRPMGQVIIGAWRNPFEAYGTFPMIWNDSSYDIYLNYPLCVHNSNPSVINRSNWTQLSSVCTTQNIGWLYPWVTKTYESLNWWNNINISWVRITENVSYKDTVLTTTAWNMTSAFFAVPLNVRVSKPAVATVWGWTSVIKNSWVTADINKVASNGYSDPDKNKNFVWAWVSTWSISSYSKQVTWTNTVNKVTSQTKTATNLNKVTTTKTSWNKNITDTLTKYNWLSNVFIVKNWNLTINSSTISWSWARTYIVENWNLYINQNITYSDNIAFVVKWWDIIIASNVTKITGTLISIKVGWVWWKITSSETDNKLVVYWSLYWNIDSLVNNRTNIENKNNLINVWTVVSFGSNLFRKQAPLVWDFIWEYVKSTKVAK